MEVVAQQWAEPLPTFQVKRCFKGNFGCCCAAVRSASCAALTGLPATLLTDDIWDRLSSLTAAVYLLLRHGFTDCSLLLDVMVAC